MKYSQLLLCFVFITITTKAFAMYDYYYIDPENASEHRVDVRLSKVEVSAQIEVSIVIWHDFESYNEFANWEVSIGPPDNPMFRSSIRPLIEKERGKHIESVSFLIREDLINNVECRIKYIESGAVVIPLSKWSGELQRSQNESQNGSESQNGAKTGQRSVLIPITKRFEQVLMNRSVC